MNKQEIKQLYLNSTDRNDRFILRREFSSQNISGKGEKSDSYFVYTIYLKENFPQFVDYRFFAKATVKKGEVECESLYTVSKILEAKTELNAYYEYLNFVKVLEPRTKDKYLVDFYLTKANSVRWVKKMIRKQRKYICKLKHKNVLD